MKIKVIHLFEHKREHYYAYRIKKGWLIVDYYCGRDLFAFDRKDYTFVLPEGGYNKTQIFSLFQLLFWVIFRRKKITFIRDLLFEKGAKAVEEYFKTLKY